MSSQKEKEDDKRATEIESRRRPASITGGALPHTGPQPQSIPVRRPDLSQLPADVRAAHVTEAAVNREAQSAYSTLDKSDLVMGLIDRDSRIRRLESELGAIKVENERLKLREERLIGEHKEVLEVAARGFIETWVEKAKEALARELAPPPLQALPLDVMADIEKGETELEEEREQAVADELARQEYERDEFMEAKPDSDDDE